MKIDYMGKNSLAPLIEKIYGVFAQIEHSHSKSDITDFPEIPTKTSDLVNDSGFKTTDNNTTYTLTKDGETIVLTGSDGSAMSVEDSDTKITVDSALSSSSTNPVQNKVINEQFGVVDGEINKLDSDISMHTSNKNNPHNVNLTQIGVTASTTELNYLAGSTSNIQTQLNKKANDFSIEIYNGTGGNPKPVRFASFNYSSCNSENGIAAKISLVSGHGNGSSYAFLEDVIIRVSYTGAVEADTFKYYGAATGTYDGENRQYGDIFWLVDTTNKIVDFYCLMGQHARVYQTPWKRLTHSSGGAVTQHTSCTVYSSGTKVWANNSDIALMSDLESLYYTKTEVDSVLSGKASSSHTHDDRYYTESEIDSKVYTLNTSISGKAASSHSHSAATTSAAGFMSASDKSKLDGITASADSVSFSRSLSSGTKIGTLTINGTGTDLYCQTNTDTDTHYTTRLYAGASGTATNAATTSPYIKVTDDNTYRNQIRLIGSGATTVTSDASGNITISSTDTNTNTNTTYSLSKSGSTITLTGSDGSKTSVTDSDTNTVYTHPTSSGNKHIPSGGSSGQILRWSADGTAAWGADNNTTYSAATQSNNGLMSAADKKKLDDIATGANAYSLPTASSSTLGGVKTTSTVTSTSGLTACPIISGVPYYKDTNTTYSLGSFGITATAAELNYTDGVTSNIQTQLNNKANKLSVYSNFTLKNSTLASTSVTDVGTLSVSLSGATSSTWLIIGRLDILFENENTDIDKNFCKCCISTNTSYNNVWSVSGLGVPAAAVQLCCSAILTLTSDTTLHLLAYQGTAGSLKASNSSLTAIRIL